MADNRFFTNKGPFSIKEIAEYLVCKLFAPAGVNETEAENTLVQDVNTLESANSTELTFFSNAKYIKDFEETNCLVCITSEQYLEKAPQAIWKLVSNNPYKDYAIITNLFYPSREEITLSYVSPTARIHESSQIGQNCYIGDNVVIEENVEIGNNCSIDAGTVIKKGVVIGDNARISSNVNISHSIIGNDVLILSGVCIGQDGFGFATDKGIHFKVSQLGRVVIGNDVEIGANTTIDRGAIGDTVIGDLCRIDNLVQIGHNVIIGKGCVIVSQVGIAGSTKIGDYCVIGGQAGFVGHIEVGSYSQIAGQSGVTKSLPEKSIVGGHPAQAIRDWQKQQLILRQLQEKNKVKIHDR
jgi:UDP-3-O-[3-hydroxymyristoyl] glucosamine N-acyltransferase